MARRGQRTKRHRRKSRPSDWRAPMEPPCFDEPQPVDDGDPSYFDLDDGIPVGYTSGGAAFGITVEEFREYSETNTPKADWVRAKNAIRDLAERQQPSAAVHVDWVTRGDVGARRTAWFANLTQCDLTLPNQAPYATA